VILFCLQGSVSNLEFFVATTTGEFKVADDVESLNPVIGNS